MGDQLSELIDAPRQGQGAAGWAPPARYAEPRAGSVPPARYQSAPSTRYDEADERLARRSLRAQIARLEGELAAAFVTAFEMGADALAQPPAPAFSAPRLLDLGELELIRDELTGRLREVRSTITRCADQQDEKRRLLERMLLQPGHHRFTRVSCHELGEPGCGVWQVRPRLGLIGMLMGWWQVKLSSGCPLAGGRRPASWPRRP